MCISGEKGKGRSRVPRNISQNLVGEWGNREVDIRFKYSNFFTPVCLFNRRYFRDYSDIVRIKYHKSAYFKLIPLKGITGTYGKLIHQISMQMENVHSDLDRKYQHQSLSSACIEKNLTKRKPFHALSVKI